MGPTKPEGVLVVGGGPSREDVKSGEVLSGATGRELDGILQEAGLDRANLKVVAAWACQGHEPKKEVEERAATLACRPLVAKTLASVPPETPVLLAGKWAQLSVDGREQGLFTRRGFREDDWRIGDPLRKDREKADE